GFADASAEFGDIAAPTVLVPMVSMPAELAVVAAALVDLDVELPLGAMVETPRAALCSAMLAPTVSTLSFGTNDLTQLTYGLSRDDSAPLLAQYRRRGLIERDPFTSVDPVGVARLIALSVETARGANAAVTFSLCGVHAADPATVGLARHLGITTLSVSPSQVPAARLAAAHAVLGVS
ncbi:MAG: pyruvate, phosphate dikinase, partial [Actinobacteria bacterium]|nr:pyruvate, phosphate dikinase [Actinomycetota bacterium]